jgi:hypothetical protein
MVFVTSTSPAYYPVSDLTLPFMPSNRMLIKNDEVEEMLYGTEKFNALRKDLEIRSKIMRSFEDGTIIFFCDSDVLINAPMEWFEEQLKDNDAIFQSDSGTCCLGLFVLRTSPKMTELFEKMEGMIDAGNCDQDIFNAIKGDFPLKIALFDTRDVWNYGVIGRRWEGQVFEFPPTLKAFHANYTIGVKNKVKLLTAAIKKYK